MNLFSTQTANSPQINLAESAQGDHTKIFTVVLQASIAIFTVSLAWFSFIYYPKVVDRFKGVGLPQKTVVTQAANFGQFPIETGQFRIIYEESSKTYYAFIEGENLAEFADNKNRATLALKSALSLESVCTLNVIYASTAKLEVPQDLKNPASCR